MSNSNQNDVTQARTQARDLAQRLENDPAFREQVKANPVDALTAAGLPHLILMDFMREIDAEPEVAGYLMADCDISCDESCRWTCGSSCVESCTYTVIP